MIEWQVTFREFNTQVTTEMIQAGPNAALQNLTWSWKRAGGCNTFEFEATRPFDQRGGIDFYRDVELRIEGTVWWRGYVVGITPILEEPERIQVTCNGYSTELESAWLTWYFPRVALRDLSELGEIAGIVKFLIDIFPNLTGRPVPVWSQALKRYVPPHPICDGIDIDQSAYRPKELTYRNESVRRIIAQLATLSGNYEWGVDQNRLFYFKCPQDFTARTAEYSTDSTEGELREDDPGSGEIFYGDETYTEPQVLGSTIPVRHTCVLGHNVQSWQDGVNAASLKNVAYVYISAPPGPFGEIAVPRAPVVVVLNTRSIMSFGRRQPLRISAPGISNADDARHWGIQHLKIIGEPQVQGALVLRGLEHPLEARGGLRIVPNDARTVMGRGLNPGEPRIERIDAVVQSFEGDEIVTKIALGFAPPQASETIGERLREQNVLLHDRSSEETSTFIQVVNEVPDDIYAAPLPTLEAA